MERLKIMKSLKNNQLVNTTSELKADENDTQKIMRKTIERQHLHDLYIWAKGGKKPEWVTKNEKRPDSEEWIATLSNNAKYLWDDFDRRYGKYYLGKGIFD